MSKVHLLRLHHHFLKLAQIDCAAVAVSKEKHARPDHGTLDLTGSELPADLNAATCMKLNSRTGSIPLGSGGL